MQTIKELRSKMKISQKELADRLNVSRSTISMWETGASQPDFDNVLKIAEIFDVSVDYLIGREADSDTSKPSENITFDDFTFAFHNETSSLTESEKELLLSMARKLNEAKKSGREAD